MMQAGNCSGRKALLTTRKKISVARTLHWTILSVNGLLKKRKKKSGSFFLEHGIDLEALKADQNMTDVDDFDFICHVAFDKKPLTRRERAENVKNATF